MSGLTLGELLVAKAGQGVRVLVCRLNTPSTIQRIKRKRVFNLLRDVNQGCGLLLARDLEKGQPGALINTLEKIECSLIVFSS